MGCLLIAVHSTRRETTNRITPNRSNELVTVLRKVSAALVVEIPLAVSSSFKSIPKSIPLFNLHLMPFALSSPIPDHIICPCSRCVDSVSKHRRSANGHRWVFHYGEVTSKERTYVAHEPGVHQPRPSINSILRQTSQTSFLSITDEPELELSKPEPAHYHLEGNQELIYDSSSSLRSRHHLRSGRNYSSSSRDMPLKEGDPVYWHQLVSAGERALPVSSRPISHTSRPAR